MADPLLPFVDTFVGNAENFGNVQRPISVSGKPTFKSKQAGLQSARKALGNITNNGSAVGSRKAVFAAENAAQSSSQQQKDVRLEDLVRGGVERPMGATFDEQEARREMSLMDVGTVDAAGHRARVVERAASLCKSLSVGGARRRALIDAVFSVSTPDAMPAFREAEDGRGRGADELVMSRDENDARDLVSKLEIGDIYLP